MYIKPIILIAYTSVTISFHGFRNPLKCYIIPLSDHVMSLNQQVKAILADMADISVLNL